VENSTGVELALPAHWRRAVLNVKATVEPVEAIWVGRDVKKNQIVGLDISKMKETPDGWVKP
jgi:hypothetical protein